MRPGERLETPKGILHTAERLEEGEAWELRQRLEEYLP